MGRDVVFFDLESDCAFKDCAGATRKQQMQVMHATVACALSIARDLCVDPDRAGAAMEAARARTFWQDGRRGFEPLLELFDTAEVIVAYNGLGFDFPLLRKHYASQDRYLAHRLKCVDPFALIRMYTDVWPKLDSLLRENGLNQKIADGLLAIKYWKLGMRDLLEEYCASDVSLLAQLCLRREIVLPTGEELPNHAFGIASHLRIRGDGAEG